MHEQEQSEMESGLSAGVAHEKHKHTPETMDRQLVYVERGASTSPSEHTSSSANKHENQGMLAAHCVLLARSWQCRQQVVATTAEATMASISVGLWLNGGADGHRGTMQNKANNTSTGSTSRGEISATTLDGTSRTWTSAHSAQRTIQVHESTKTLLQQVIIERACTHANCVS